MKNTPHPATNSRPLLLDDYPKSFERGRALGPTTHTQMSSLEDSTIRVAQAPSKRVLPSLPGGLAMPNSASTLNPIVAWVGLDWADQQHVVCLQAAGSSALEHSTLEHKP